MIIMAMEKFCIYFFNIIRYTKISILKRYCLTIILKGRGVRMSSNIKNLPASLHTWIEEVVLGIRPLKMEDYYREQLQEKASSLYETYLSNLNDPVRAEARTIEELGDRKDVRSQIEEEIRKDTERQKGNLWKVPMVVSAVFFVVFCVSAVACVLAAMKPGGWDSFLHTAFHMAGIAEKGSTGVVVYGNLIGSSLVWAVVSVLFMAFCWVLAFRLKKR